MTNAEENIEHAESERTNQRTKQTGRRVNVQAKQPKHTHTIDPTVQDATNIKAKVMTSILVEVLWLQHFGYISLEIGTLYRSMTSDTRFYTALGRRKLERRENKTVHMVTVLIVSAIILRSTSNCKCSLKYRNLFYFPSRTNTFL